MLEENGTKVQFRAECSARCWCQVLDQHCWCKAGVEVPGVGARPAVVGHGWYLAWSQCCN